MVAYYSVIRYVPDPIADERINIGVLAFNEGRVLAHFVADWSRVIRFAGEDIAFLRDFAQDVSDGIGLQEVILSGVPRIDAGAIRRMAQEWATSIQLSDPRPSLSSPEELLVEMSEAMLRSRPRITRDGRTRADAARLMIDSLANAVIERAGSKAKGLVKSYCTLSGLATKHRVDAAILNGTAYAAADGLSFEILGTEDLPKEVGNIAWSCIDLRGRYPNLPFAVLALPPGRLTDAYRDLKNTTKSLDIALIEENQVEEWAGDAARKIPSHVLAAYTEALVSQEPLSVS